MPLANYGQTSPQALDPWPIESVLAPLATGGSRAEAQNMLGHYQIARDTAQNLYEGDLQQQHEFAKQQLTQQLTEARMKQAEALLKTPGGARYLSDVGGSSGLGYGDNPTAMAGLAGASDLAQSAVNLEKFGSGSSSLRTAGMAVDPAQIASATGLSMRAVPTPAELRLQGDTKRAGARAASGPGETATFPNRWGGQSSVPFGKGMTPEQKDKFVLENFGKRPVDAPPADLTLPPASSTNLPPASTKTAPTNKPAATPAPDNEQAGAEKLRQALLANMDKIPKDVAADIKAGAAKNGGIPVVGVDEKGPYALGAKGQKYR